MIDASDRDSRSVIFSLRLTDTTSMYDSSFKYKSLDSQYNDLLDLKNTIATQTIHDVAMGP